MSQYATIAQALADVAVDYPDNTYVFQDMQGNEHAYTFADMERETARRAGALQHLGLQKGDRLGLIIVEPEDFVLTFFAAVRIGVLPVPLYPPLSFGSLDAYAERTSNILTSAGAKAIVASSALKNILFSQVDLVPSCERFIEAQSLATDAHTPEFPDITPDDVCFLQYTSGSTADPKGVIVSHRSLVANCTGFINDGAEMTPENGDKAISWLPLYHDMGLIGFVIAPIIHGVPAVFIPTVRFIRRPSVWLDTIHRHRGTATFAPNFAYALVMKRVKDSQLDAWDLSCLRVCGCGAEPIHPDIVRRFTALMEERCNLSPAAFLPAYGMAEATLAMSFKPVNERFRTIHVDADAFQETGRVQQVVHGRTSLEHVSCGKPFPGHEICAMSGDTRLPEGVEGELCFRGPSVTDGYWEDPEGTAHAYRNGWLHTGDLGYVLHGEVYVTGRMKDLIILNGRNLHPQSIEWVAGAVDGVRKGNVVAFSRPGTGTEELVLAVETRARDTEALTTAVTSAVTREMGLTVADVVLLKPGTLPKTSSGKLQRSKARTLYLTDRLGKEGNRNVGASAGRITLARHVAWSLWSRVKTAVRGPVGHSILRASAKSSATGTGG